MRSAVGMLMINPSSMYLTYGVDVVLIRSKVLMVSLMWVTGVILTGHVSLHTKIYLSMV